MSDLQLGSDEPMSEEGKRYAADLQARLAARAEMPDVQQAFASVYAQDALASRAMADLPEGQFDSAGMGRGE